MSRVIGNGLDLANRPIDNVADPSTGQQAATKNYVDNVARGLDWKESVRAASTGNINLASPGATIDGVTMATNERFLAKDQSTGSQNGIYVWNGAAVAATRAIDADSNTEVTSGMAVSVTEGTVNGDRVYILTTNDPITLGTTALVFTQLGGGAGTYVAGNGLTESPAGTFNVGQGNGILVTADAVAIDSAVVARKFATNIGNGALTTITVTHSLGTLDVGVTVFNNATGAEIIADVNHTGINTVDIIFATAPTSNQYRVVVVG